MLRVLLPEIFHLLQPTDPILPYAVNPPPKLHLFLLFSPALILLLDLPLKLTHRLLLEPILHINHLNLLLKLNLFLPESLNELCRLFGFYLELFGFQELCQEYNTEIQRRLDSAETREDYTLFSYRRRSESSLRSQDSLAILVGEGYFGRRVQRPRDRELAYLLFSRVIYGEISYSRLLGVESDQK